MGLLSRDYSKNLIFCVSIKMDRASVINIKDFEFELFELKKPIEMKSKDNKSFKYTSAPFVYDDKEVLIKMSGIFRSFTNVKDGQVSYSIRMTVDETNKDFLLALEHRIRGQVALQIHDVNKEYLNLINFSDNKNISLKVYASRSLGSAMNCKFTRKVDGKLETTPPENIADTAFTGTCIFSIVDFFIAAVKTIRLVPKEFLIKEIESELS